MTNGAKQQRQKNCGLEVPEGYSVDRFGFIKQVRHDHFDYDIEYKMRQGTNIEMSFLRLGWLAACISYEKMKQMDVVDIGCGNGCFVDCCENFFKNIYGYDVCGESITRHDLVTHRWDLIVMSDVLEHFEEIDELFGYHWQHAMISFPETPEVGSFGELLKWRHFKPNEHIYCLHMRGIIEWMKEKDSTVKVLQTGHFEDFIRTRWDADKPNVSTVLVSRDVDA